MLEGFYADNEAFGDQTVQLDAAVDPDAELDDVLRQAGDTLLDHIKSTLGPEALAKGLAAITGEDPDARFLED